MSLIGLPCLPQFDPSVRYLTLNDGYLMHDKSWTLRCLGQVPFYKSHAGNRCWPDALRGTLVPVLHFGARNSLCEEPLAQAWCASASLLFLLLPLTPLCLLALSTCSLLRPASSLHNPWQRSQRAEMYSWLQRVWPLAFEPALGPVPERVWADSNGQFLVTREAIRARDKGVWQRMDEALQGEVGKQVGPHVASAATSEGQEWGQGVAGTDTKHCLGLARGRDGRTRATPTLRRPRSGRWPSTMRLNSCGGPFSEAATGTRTLTSARPANQAHPRCMRLDANEYSLAA